MARFPQTEVYGRDVSSLRAGQYALVDSQTGNRITDVVYVVLERTHGVLSIDVFQTREVRADYIATHLQDCDQVILSLVLPQSK